MANMNTLFFYEPFYETEQQLIGSPFTHPSRHHTRIATPPTSSRALKPKLDLHENTEKNLVTATFELPGLKKEQVQLNIHSNILIVSAENNTSSEHEEQGYVIRERSYGKLSRSLRLPDGITEQDVKASMTDGVLTITFPKATPEQEPKKIAIA